MHIHDLNIVKIIPWRRLCETYSTYFEFFTPGIYDLIFLIGYFYLRLFSDDIRYIAASSSWVYSDDCF